MPRRARQDDSGPELGTRSVRPPARAAVARYVRDRDQQRFEHDRASIASVLTLDVDGHQDEVVAGLKAYVRHRSLPTCGSRCLAV